MNWGNRLMFTFIAFALMIGYLVYRAFGTKFDLVEKEYYKSELKYQDVINGTGSANALSTAVQVTQFDSSIVIQMPDEMKKAAVTGKVWFYCAYDSKKDRQFSLKINEDGAQVLRSNEITPGNYIVKIDWAKDGNSFYTEKQISIQ